MTLSTDPILFDPSDLGLRKDPYPTYRRMREEAPVWRAPDGIWYLSRYADGFELLRNSQLSYDRTLTSTFQQRLSPDPERRAEQLEEYSRHLTMLDVDPPEHTRLRSLVNRAFTAPTVEGIRGRVVEVVDSLMDDFDSSSVDLVGDFGMMVPILVICEMLGVPAEERSEFVEIGDAMARTVDLDVPFEERLVALQRQNEYIVHLIQRRRRHPGDDLITRLIEAADDGRLASDDELVANTGLLLIAGFETTTNLITNAVYQLLRHPAELDVLRADPSVIATTIEEVLRFDPPVQMSGRPRTVHDDVSVGGITLHPGDTAVIVIAAANRDPAEFPDPERFDIRRSPNRHMTFGMGIHLCAGAALGRLEARIAVQHLIERFPDLELGREEPEYRTNLALRGFSRLIVNL
jgi:cytochrome P450